VQQVITLKNYLSSLITNVSKVCLVMLNIAASIVYCLLRDNFVVVQYVPDDMIFSCQKLIPDITVIAVVSHLINNLSNNSKCLLNYFVFIEVVGFHYLR
jgi:hypothetical protein